MEIRMKKQETDQKSTPGKIALTVVFAVISVIWMMPIIIVLYNSLKTNGAVNTQLFALPNAETYVGFDNYINGMTFGNYPFYFSAGYSVFITLASTFLILLCTSMAAWYVSRVNDLFSKVVYYLCVFSMVVPFQMVMFTLANTARELHLDTPWSIPVVYLGFGAGLAVFMFVGFVKSIPIDIEEAASIDGCGPLRTFFSVVLPMMKPTLISVGVLEIMWVWNDYLLPYLVLDVTKYKTIPIHIQYLQGSYGRVDLDHPKSVTHCDLLPDLPEAHHQRCRCRCGQRISNSCRIRQRQTVGKVRGLGLGFCHIKVMELVTIGNRMRGLPKSEVRNSACSWVCQITFWKYRFSAPLN